MKRKESIATIIIVNIVISLNLFESYGFQGEALVVKKTKLNPFSRSIIVKRTQSLSTLKSAVYMKEKDIDNDEKDDISIGKEIENKQKLEESLTNLFEKSTKTRQTLNKLRKDNINESYFDGMHSKNEDNGKENYKMNKSDLDGLLLKDFDSYVQSIPNSDIEPERFNVDTASNDDINDSSLYFSMNQQYKNITKYNADELYQKVFENENENVTKHTNENIQQQLRLQRSLHTSKKQKKAIQSLQHATKKPTKTFKPPNHFCIQCGVPLTEEEIQHSQTCHICHAQQFQFKSGKLLLHDHLISTRTISIFLLFMSFF